MTEHDAGVKKMSAARWAALNFVLTLAYFAFGKFGLALALPPGYVSALWPAAGVAFAAALVWGGGRVWLGIFLGSLVTNASMGGGFNVNGIAAGIAAGSALQAVVGSWWLRRSNPALVLDSPARVLKFSLLGILSCLIAASIGNLTLFAHGVISITQVPQSFVTWWLGDAFGVQIFAPLTLLVLAPNAAWIARRISVGLPLLLVFSLCGVIYYFVSQAEERQLTRNFAIKAAPLITELNTLDRTHGTALAQLATIARITGFSSATNFNQMAGEIVTRLPAFRAISWNPVLPAADNEKFAVLARAVGVADAKLNYPQGFSPAADGRAVPVLFVYPMAGNESAIGLDLMGEPDRRSAVEAALTSGKLAVTRPLRLAQDPEGPGAVLLMAPAISPAGAGLMVGILDLRLIEKEMARLPNVVWELHEVTAKETLRVAGNAVSPLPEFVGETRLDRAGVYVQHTIPLADREWRLVLHMMHSHLAGESGNASLLVLCLALFSCGVFANFALIMSGDRERIGGEVALKTQALQDEVAERKRYEAELKQARDDAQTANIAKSQFLATMSHEIRTPMNGILGMAQLLMMDDVTDAERKEYVRTILGSGQSLMTILNDILDLSKVEAGKMELQMAPFEPSGLLAEVATLFREAAQSKGLSLAVASELSRMRVVGDALRLRQMLSNLVGNAIKFSERGQIDLTVRELADADLPPEQVRLEFAVRDRGIGIADDKRTILFQPFVQVDGSATRRFGGTGLGLSIVRRLAQLMGGDVSVDSREGEGSRFVVTMVAQRIPENADTRRGERLSPVTTASADASFESGGWVLVAEDIATNRMVVTALLAKLGIEARCAEDGAKAIELLERYRDTPPRVILMDCQMPVLDGYQATAAIRRTEREHGHPRCRIIALTAGAFAEDRERCQAAGMDDFLAKPLVFEDLLAALRRAGTSAPE